MAVHLPSFTESITSLLIVTVDMEIFAHTCEFLASQIQSSP